MEASVYVILVAEKPVALRTCGVWAPETLPPLPPDEGVEYPPDEGVEYPPVGVGYGDTLGEGVGVGAGVGEQHWLFVFEFPVVDTPASLLQFPVPIPPLVELFDPVEQP